MTSQPGFSAPNKDPDCDWIMRMKAVMGKKGGNKSQRQRKKAFGWDTKGGAPARGPSIKLDSGAAALGSRADGYPGFGPMVPSPLRWGRGLGAGPS